MARTRHRSGAAESLSLYEVAGDLDGGDQNLVSGDIDFDEGLPNGAPPQSASRKRGPAGSRYRAEIDFDDGLPRSSPRPVAVRKAAAAPSASGESGGGGASPKKKAAPHVHGVTVGGKALTTSPSTADPGVRHSHTVPLETGPASTTSDPGGPGHTHSIDVDGKKVSTARPRAPAKKQDSTTIQTLIFDKGRFKSSSAARAWATDHGFKSNKVDETEQSYRLRQRDPSAFRDGSFRTIDLTDGVKAVIGRPKTRKADVTTEEFHKVSSAVPRVLTWEAVRAGDMPARGESGLPRSLEQDVPPRYRYWKCDSDPDARLVRDALVETGVFVEGSIRPVDGQPRRVITERVLKVYLPPPYDDDEPVVVPPAERPIEKAAAMLAPPEQDGSPVTMFDEDVVAAVGLETIVGRVSSLKADWIIAAEDTPENRRAVGGPAFRIPHRGDLIFATSCRLEDPSEVEWVAHDRPGEVLKHALADDHVIRLLKADRPDEERIVAGVVLEPDEVDSQGDTISAEEIRQAAHKFMEDFQQLGVQHKEIVNGKLKLLETSITEVDFTVDGQPVKKGSWIMKQRVADDALWAGVKKGEFTGFSIGGSAIRRPA